MTILDEIIENKRQEVAERKNTVPIAQLCKSHFFARSPLSLKQKLLNSSIPEIIAEFKRKSPSKGWINRDADVKYITSGYAAMGAAGISILTDEVYFGGSQEDILQSRDLVSCPILRKDFIIDEYQIYEAKAMGADVILLIAAALTSEMIKEYVDIAHRTGLEVLFEIHSESELNKADCCVDIIGVNNRDLKTFKTDITTSLNLVKKINMEYAMISESGISSSETIEILYKSGYRGFLMGENFMKEKDPPVALKKIMEEL